MTTAFSESMVLRLEAQRQPAVVVVAAALQARIVKFAAELNGTIAEPPDPAATSIGRPQRADQPPSIV